MTRIAVFPGQGAQSVGMGRSFVQSVAASGRVFAEVDAALEAPISRLVFDGPEDALTLTRNAQPALMATSLAAVRAVEEAAGKPFGELIDYAAGHSLGEYSALAALGALPVGLAARLLRLRGQAMQEAVAPGEGAMAAILGLPTAAVEALADEVALPSEPCELANDNSDGQAVLSGARAAVERAVALAKARGARRAVLLQVSAPFHCALMRLAAIALRPALLSAGFLAPVRPVIANVTAEPVDDPTLLPDLLTAQVTGRVRWRETMATMDRLGVTTVVEFGPGRVLAGLVKRTLPAVRVVAVQTVADVPDAIAALAA